MYEYYFKTNLLRGIIPQRILHDRMYVAVEHLLFISSCVVVTLISGLLRFTFGMRTKCDGTYVFVFCKLLHPFSPVRPSCVYGDIPRTLVVTRTAILFIVRLHTYAWLSAAESRMEWNLGVR